MNTKQKLLIIEAHSDDSAISIGGFLEKYKAKYEYHFGLMAVSGRNTHHAGFIPRKTRLEEYERYVNHFGGIWHKNDIFPR